MSTNQYVENDNGFFVKVTLFKDDVNKAKWRLPFTDEAYKQLSRSLGKVPYIDLKGKTYDEHKQFDTDKLIEQLQSQGIDDAPLVEAVRNGFDKESNGKKGYVVDMYDVQKKASYGGILNRCELSAELVKDSNPEVAVADFILRIDDKDYRQQIKDGEVIITPSPSIYGTNKIVDGIRLYDPTQYLDFLHVANATIPANGEHAKMKGFCEGTQSVCKKSMANASVSQIETNINNTVTKDSSRMSSIETPNPPVANEVVTEPSNDNKGFTGEDVLKLFEQYNLPKEVIAKFDKLSNELSEVKTASESTSKKLADLEAKEQERKVNERKSLMLKHIDLQKHFKGDTEKFTQKVDWINKHFANDEDLSVYLAEAFPIQVSADSNKKDNPQKEGAYAGMLFKAEDLLTTDEKIVTSSEKVSKAQGWGNLIALT